MVLIWSEYCSHDWQRPHPHYALTTWLTLVEKETATSMHYEGCKNGKLFDSVIVKSILSFTIVVCFRQYKTGG